MIRWLRDYCFGLVIIILAIVSFAGMIFMILFGTLDYTVVLINPSDEQVLQLYKAHNTQEGFWVRNIHVIKGERSLLESTVGVHILDGESKVRETLDELGIDYYLVGPDT